MAQERSESTENRIEPLDLERFRERLQIVAARLFPDRLVDDLEVQHLLRVINECSLLLTDVYSDERIARIMRPGREDLADLVDHMIERERQGEGEVLFRVRRLPEDVRVIGDKALFDLGLRGLGQVKGYDLGDLGSRAYKLASETLAALAEDQRLRQFFKDNRLLMLPLEEEVVFLRQCSEKFSVHADILKAAIERRAIGESLPIDDASVKVPLMATAAAGLADTGEPERREGDDPYLEAARGEGGAGSFLSRDQLISAYERMVLFSALEMDRLRSALRETVVDQNEAIETLCDEFGLYAAGTRDLRKPPAYFLVGPTGVGKNHLVESLCRVLEGVWDVEVPVLTIEGPNYTYPSDINELRGATRGFIRSDEEGLLTAFHERSSRSPLSVILVDEVEKAHPQLLRFFLSILDRGTTTDNRGEVLNFSNCILFFTSNLGYSDVQQSAAPIGYMDDDARSETSDRDVRRGLRRGLTPEFMNRVRIVHFGRLTRGSADRILELELARIRRRYREVHGLGLEVAPSAREELIRRGFSPTYGARHLATTLERVCNVEVAKKVRRDDDGDGGNRQALVNWLRELRDGRRAFDLEQVKRRVIDSSRARLGYDTLRVVFDDGEFDYLPVDGGEPGVVSS
jgi:hypothetical protein